MKERCPYPGYDPYKRSLELLDRVKELEAENAKLRKKLLRVRDWLKFEANADSGICSEIDDAARAEVDNG